MLKRASLRVKLSATVGLLMGAVGVFLFLFLPAHIGAILLQQARARAEAVVVLLEAVVEPSLDIPGAEILIQGDLETLAPAAGLLYAAVSGEDGKRVAGWHDRQMPALEQKDRADDLEMIFTADGLHVLLPMQTRNGVKGLLRVGFPISALKEQEASNRRTVALVTAIFVAIGILASIILGTYLVRPIRELTTITGNIVARGDLTQQIKIRSEDEVGHLARTFSELLGKLRTIPQTLGPLSDEVVRIADHITGTSTNVMEGTQVVQSRVEDTSATVTQTLASLRGIASNVEVLHKSARESSASNAELVALNQEVTQKVQEMTTAVKNATEAIERMAVSARQMAGNIQDLNGSVAETSGAISKMDVSIGQIERNASDTAKLSRAASEEAAGGVAALQETVAGIDRIRKASIMVSGVIGSLRDRIGQIGTIVDVINDITEQTNLLSLNAAIIAASAGEHGRGFAVVADEIKDLATRTAGSTREINELITGIQTESEEAKEAMDTSLSSVEEAVDLGRATSVTLAGIAANIDKATAMVQAIAASTLNQAQTSRQITTSTKRIVEAVAEIADRSREQARSSEQVQRAAFEMRSVTDQVRDASRLQQVGSSRIAESVERINQMTVQLNRAQKDQTEGAERVLLSVEAIREVVNEQRGATAELGAAVAALREGASALDSALHQFRV